MYLNELLNLCSSDEYTGPIEVLSNEDEISWIKAIAGFANCSGGVIYIGTYKNNKMMDGLGIEDANDVRLRLLSETANSITPKVDINTEIIKYIDDYTDKYIIKVSVIESALKPVIVKRYDMSLIYMYRNGCIAGATYEEIMKMSIGSSKVSFDMLASDIEYDSSRFSDLNSFYEHHNNGAKLTEEILFSTGFISRGGYLTNGAVLFMDNYDGKKNDVQFAVYPGLTKGSNYIISINRFRGNIPSSIKFITDHMKIRITQAEYEINGINRYIDSYPLDAVLECFLYAITHRDYYIDGSQIQIDMFVDRLEISVPGSLFNDRKSHRIYDLSEIKSAKCNEIITNILKGCNVLFTEETEFVRTIKGYSEADNNHKPYIYSTSDHFTLVLPDLTYITA